MDSMAKKAKVVFLWHMHQPDYRDIVSGEYYFPWTYLHAIKDYVDMAAHLESEPRAKAVVNFAPILLEQLDDYANQINGYLSDATPIKDKILAALVSDELPDATDPSYLELTQLLLRVNRARVIERFPVYHELASIAEDLPNNPRYAHYVNAQFLIDLNVWYQLGWMGEVIRREDSRIHYLQDKGAHFSLDDRKLLLSIIGELVNSIVPRYRALAEKGQIELCMSPYAHPIVPLLIDINSNKEAMPDAPLPECTTYPGGLERSRWHLTQGINTFRQHFGITPSGCWPSEGALSDATLTLFAEAGFTWTATGNTVLHNSLHAPENHEMFEALQHSAESLHRAYTHSRAPLNVFFRDDGLSDLIGFQYSTWHADDAIGDLIQHMKNIAEQGQGEEVVISVIMDGENAWEYYPENAFHFLSKLYTRLLDEPQLELTTYSDVGNATATLNRVVAGSWVYGTFSTWIGDKDKNRGWDMLCDAKRATDHALATKTFSSEHIYQIEKQLALCEGSDWFWWFGDYNPAQSVGDFDYLYRQHLLNLYRLLEEPAPEYLDQVISYGGGDPAAGGVMRQGQQYT